MGIKQDVKERREKFSITKIEGQPGEEVLNKLKEELTAMLATVPKTNGGGHHGHVGLIISGVQYVTEHFVLPTNPGPYPSVVDPDPVICERQVAEHIEEYKEFETCLGCEHVTHQKIVGAVDPKWLEALCDPILGFAHVSPMQMLEHLDLGRALIDYMDVMELMAQLIAPWELTENPATKFACYDKIERQLISFGLGDQLNLHLALALAAFKGKGKYNDSICELEARAAPDKMLTNFCPYIINEYAKKFKTNQSTAKSVGFRIANSATT